MRGPLDIHRELLEAGVPHEIVHLPRRIESARDLPDILGVPAPACPMLEIYDTGAAPVAVLVPAGYAVVPERLAEATGAPALRLASPGQVSEITDCSAAYASPIGLPGDLTVLADIALLDEEVHFTTTGDGSTALKIRAGDLLVATRAKLESLTEMAPVPAPVLAAGAATATLHPPLTRAAAH